MIRSGASRRGYQNPQKLQTLHLFRVGQNYTYTVHIRYCLQGIFESMVVYGVHIYVGLARTVYTHRVWPYIYTKNTRGGYGQKWYNFCMLLGYGPPNLHVSSSAVKCRFQCSWAWNVQIRGPIPNRPRRDPYFLSSHMLYLTSQRTKLSNVWCFESLNWIKIIAITNGAKRASG
jgi:hypothetical protein